MADTRPRSVHHSRVHTPSSPSRRSENVGITASATPGSFADLGVSKALIDCLTAQGILEPFPIQTATMRDALAGRDVLGRGKTGSGKTLAFVLPMLERLSKSKNHRRPGLPRALILAPTRELATQIHAVLRPLAAALGMTTATIFGGVGAAPQTAALRAGLDVVVACPGRLTDHLDSGHARLDCVEVTVLDEADHMADLGFLPAVTKLLQRTPEHSQRLLFSATLDAGVAGLVKKFLHDPVTHSVDSEQSPVSEMVHHVLHVGAEDRFGIIVALTAAPGRTMVFTRTKHRAKTLARQLNAAGVPSVELHGNLAQNARVRNLEAFSTGAATTLVATDIAARGIHVDDVRLVVHADPPVEHKAYLHRSGRTARAGASGTVVTIMTDDQVGDVRDLTRKAGIRATTTKVHRGHPLLAELAPGGTTPTPVAPHVEVADRPERPRRNDGQRRNDGPRRTGTGSGTGTGTGTSSSSSRNSRYASPRPSR